MRRVTTVIIGAGHSGLAFSHCLSDRSIDHVVLERGEVANAWRTERWDALRLLTPNWLSRLPGDEYRGRDPHGFMTKTEIIDRLDRYAQRSLAPVEIQKEVRSVVHDQLGYRVRTQDEEIQCRSLVVASGACNLANVPSIAADLPRQIESVTPLQYKRPSDLPEGGVLVVGASATGLQLAREIQASGRQVTLSVGEHIRAPRRYRGRDIKWWMDAIGLLDVRADEVDDLQRARRSPSLQLTGSADGDPLDLNRFAADGGEIVGRFSGLRGRHAMFSGSLAHHCAASDLKMNRLLDAIDAWVSAQGFGDFCPPPERFPPTRLPASPRLSIDLASDEVRSVLWATGYQPEYPWLHLPVFDRKGRLRHEAGIVAPGLYAMSLPFMRRRKSTLIDGAGPDAGELVEHLVTSLERRAA
ncbi:MAG: NAD(P)-binding domain-containing protein [Pseudomonadota bacterium]